MARTSSWLYIATLASLLHISSCFVHDARVVDEVLSLVHSDNKKSMSIKDADFLHGIRDERTTDNQKTRKTEDDVWYSIRKSFLPLITSDEASPHEKQREKRDVIEEEKNYGAKNNEDGQMDSVSTATQWLPESVLPEETQQTSTKEETKLEQALPLHATTEALLERQNGRGARGTDDGHWVKLQSYPREDEQKDALTVVSPPPDDLSARMPRVNFVTQNKRLETPESRSERDSLPRAAVSRSTNELRTDFMHPSVDNRARSLNLAPPAPPVNSDSYYYPEESRRRYDQRYPDDDMYVARNPYYDMTYARRTGFNEISYRPRLDRYDNDMPYYDPILPVTPVERPSITRPKRIIYYANLPEVVRTPPNVDLRYRYTAADPYKRYDDQYTRDGRVDYRFRNRYDRYPHGLYKKDVTRARDLSVSGTDPKDKTIENERQTTPKPEENRSRKPQNNLNSYQRPMNAGGHDGYDKPFPDVARVDYMYRRYDQPSFQAAIDDPYMNRHD